MKFNLWFKNKQFLCFILSCWCFLSDQFLLMNVTTSSSIWSSHRWPITGPQSFTRTHTHTCLLTACDVFTVIAVAALQYNVCVCVALVAVVTGLRGAKTTETDCRDSRSGKRSANISSPAGPLSWLRACPHHPMSLPVRRRGENTSNWTGPDRQNQSCRHWY